MDFPVATLLSHRPVISSASDECTASDVLLAGLDFTAGPGLTVNQAYYLPLVIQSRVTITRLGYGVGNPVSGSVDIGIYDIAGARLVSTGSTVITPINSVNDIDITDTDLTPGHYFMALATNGSAPLIATNPATASWQLSDCFGVKIQASAFPLPATATFATPTSQPKSPLIVLSRRSSAI
jgi:hypothetical protein